MVLNRWIIIGLGLLILGASIPGCSTVPSPAVAPSKKPPEPPLKTMELPIPTDHAHQKYLGIESGPKFSIEDIQTQILIVEVFSMYCPHCQREAPNVNRLYRRVSTDDQWRDRIKLIGIGVGNTNYEVALFRKTYDIPFPLFPDRSRELAHQLEIRRTPTFVGFVWDDEGKPRQFMHAPGSLGDVDEFLTRVIQLAAIKTGHP